MLVEYGFTLPAARNPWDEACLDPYLCPLPSPAQRALLDEAGFWRNSQLDARTACYRTLPALRLLCLGPARWRAVLDGDRAEDRDRDAVDAALLRVLRACDDDVRAKMADIGPPGGPDDDHAHAALRARWRQIEQLVATAIARLQENQT
ncbi:hypothetical protein CDD83_8732 [Cordyceps sp. RAO-2017]|nr:hypothetical protein CDD83_8732 [Cordyceps sp. RAO-2017]